MNECVNLIEYDEDVEIGCMGETRLGEDKVDVEPPSQENDDTFWAPKQGGKD